MTPRRIVAPCAGKKVRHHFVGRRSFRQFINEPRGRVDDRLGGR
jgi:hypothetical protein